MSLELIALSKLVQLFYLPENRKISALRDDIRGEINATERTGGGGHFQIPFWAAAKAHVTGSADISDATIALVEGNWRRRRLYCIGALTFLFFPDLITPIKEREIDQGRKRIDIAYKNAAREGFFDMALRSPQLRAIEVPVECKNYQQEVANPELDQLTGRFSHVRGFRGLLCCRTFDDKDRFIERCKDAAVHRGHYVLVFDDADLTLMLENVSRGRRQDNDGFLRRRFAELTA